MKPQQKFGKKYRVVSDSKGGIELPPELAEHTGCKIGDPFACWKKGDVWLLVFPKSWRRKEEIPKDAIWGKVTPALPKRVIKVHKLPQAKMVMKPKTSHKKHTEELT